MDKAFVMMMSYRKRGSNGADAGCVECCQCVRRDFALDAAVQKAVVCVLLVQRCVPVVQGEAKCVVRVKREVVETRE